MKLFVVSTPSQAFFLSKTLGIVSRNSILLITKNLNGVDEKIIFQLQTLPWGKIFVWDIVDINSPKFYYKIIFFRLKLILLKRRYPNINELFIGSYDNSYHLGIAASFEDKAEVYLLYDGLQMVSIAEKRLENRENSIRPYSKLFKLVGFKQPSLKSITYTSPIEFKAPDFDHLIKIKTSFNKMVVLNNGLMYFAGQPLVDMGVVSFENYLKKLNCLKSKFSKKHIIYIPHPKESKEIKTEVAKIFELKYFDKIFEQEYLEAHLFAKNIVSFYSSVLINLFYIGGGSLNIYAIALNESDILRPGDRSAILKIYQYFKLGKISNLSVIKF